MQRRDAAVFSGDKATGPADKTKRGADALADAGIDELVSLVSQRLRAEFRIDRERFGRLRDSAR